MDLFHLMIKDGEGLVQGVERLEIVFLLPQSRSWLKMDRLTQGHSPRAAQVKFPRAGEVSSCATSAVGQGVCSAESPAES